MPVAKKAARKATKRTTKKGAKRSMQRTLSAAHKRALAEGRTMSATVDRYLSAVNTLKQRGRKVSKATLTERLATARERAKSATGVEKVLAAQAVRDLQNKLASINAANGTDVKSLEAEFIRIAKKFGENRGIGYGAWHDARVPAIALRAGVARTRS